MLLRGGEKRRGRHCKGVHPKVAFGAEVRSSGGRFDIIWRRKSQAASTRHEEKENPVAPYFCDPHKRLEIEVGRKMLM